MTIGQRMRSARTKMKMTQPQLATAAGVSDGIISQWENDIYEPKRVNLERVAVALRVTVDYLLSDQSGPDLSGNPTVIVDISSEMTGSGPKFNPDKPFHSESDRSILGSNVIEHPVTLSRLPLIPWTKVGDWMLTNSKAIPQKWENTTFEHGCRAFGVINEDMSMAPDYRAGEFIVIDPDIEAVTGRDVVAQLPGGAFMFRRLQQDPDGMILIALNDNWPTKIFKAPEGTRVIGVVTRSWMIR